MSHTKIYIVVAVIACIIVYLSRRTRLTFEEKKKVFAVSLAAFPIVGFAAHLVLFDMHDEAYNATQPTTSIRDRDTALASLAWLLGGGASLAVLGFADRVQKARTYEYFAELERQQRAAIERAKREEAAAEQRKLEGKLELARLESINRMRTIEYNGAADAMQKQVEALKLAHSRFSRRSDPYGEKSSHAVDDDFRHQLASRSIGKLDISLLSRSDDPFVRHILGSRPTLALTPDEAKDRNNS